MSTGWRISDDVVATDFDSGEAVLVDLKRKSYYVLNETAAAVWRGLMEERSVDEIALELTRAYDVTGEQARASVARVIGDFERAELLAGAGA